MSCKREWKTCRGSNTPLQQKQTRKQTLKRSLWRLRVPEECHLWVSKETQRLIPKHICTCDCNVIVAFTTAELWKPPTLFRKKQWEEECSDIPLPGGKLTLCETWNRPQWPSREDCIRKLVFTCATEYISANAHNEIVPAIHNDVGTPRGRVWRRVK